MLRRSRKSNFLQLITLVLLFVMVFSSVAGVLAFSAPAPNAQIEKSSIPESDNRLGNTINKFARDYIDSFSKPDLEKMGPALKSFYNARVPTENLVVRKGNEVSISVMTGPIPVGSLKKYMTVSNIFDVGFGKVVTGYIDSADQALKIAQVPGVVHLEADQDDSRKDYATILEEFQTPSLIKNRMNTNPSYPQQYDTGDIIGTSRVINELGYDGSGVRISMYDTGVDFGQMDLGNDALARLFDGTPDVLDAVGEGIVLTPKVVRKTGDYLNVSDIESSEDLTVWYDSGKYNYYTLFEGLPPPLEDMKAPSVNSQSGNYKFGIITQYVGYPTFFPVVLVDSVSSGVYDTVVVDMETAVYLTGEFLELISGGAISYVQFPGVTYDEWDFSNDAAHKWGDGTEILAKDFNADSINDFGAGMIGRTMDLNAALNGKPTLVEGINDTGTGFAIMYDNYGHGTWTSSIAAGRGISPYPIFDNDFEPVLFTEDNTTGYMLPGAAPGAKIQAIKTGGQSIQQVALMSYFWAAGFDYNTGTKQWQWTGDHYANVSSNSWGGGRLGDIAMANYIAMVRDVLSIPGFYHASYRGMLFVHAAGNSGSGMQTIDSSPATELMVGSSSKYSYHEPAYGQPQGYDQSSPYASKGPTNLGMLRPDVLAPGFLIASPSPTWWFYNDIGSGNDTFFWWSGTSASTPWGAGVAAIVYEAYYDHHANSPNPDLVKTIIMSSAKDLGLNPAIQGHGQLDAFRAVALAMENTTSDGIPVIQTTTYTTFREVAKLVNETLVSAWAEGGLIENFGGNYPGAKNLTHITEHPGISNNYADSSLYLGRINRGDSKKGTIFTTNAGFGVDSVVAKRFKETTTVTFTVTTNSSFKDINQGIGYFYPILIKKYLDAGELTDWNNAEFAWIHVSMPFAQRKITTSDEIFYCTLNDWHDDGDGIPEYANVSTAQIGEFTELSRHTHTEVNTWNLQVGKPGTAFPTGHPMVIVRSNSDTATASGFGGIQLTVLVRMFTLEPWTDITLTDISGGSKLQWNVTASVGSNADPGIYEGVLVVTKGAGEYRMPLSYMVTAPVPQGPSELVVGGTSSDDAYDNFAFYIPFDISEGAYQGADLKTYSLYVGNPSATFLAVNATWIHEDSAFNMWLFGPDLTRIGTSAIDFPGGTAPTKNFYIFDLSQSSFKNGIYTLAIEGRDINLPPEILTLKVRYLTILKSEFPSTSSTWSAANNTILTGPNAPLTVSWSQFTDTGELPDLSIVGTKLAFVRGELVNETATFGGAYGFEDKTFTRTFTQGDVVNVRIGVSPYGPDLDTRVKNPNGLTVLSLTEPYYTNPEIGQFTAQSTGTYTITTEWWGYESSEGTPSNDEDEWVMYCYTDNFILSETESQTLSVTTNTGTLGLDDGTYRVNAYALTGTSYAFTETHFYTLDNFLAPSVTVTSPNGGETVYSPVRINFTISDPNVGEVISWKIFYSNNGGSSYYSSVIGSGTGRGDQTYEWVVDPGITLGDNFKFKVVVKDEKGLSAEDESDGVFTISGAPPFPGFTIIIALIVPALLAIPILRKRRQK
ncbi:MAG: S8 family serine peptidase [Promethearchaeota archaeon]